MPFPCIPVRLLVCPLLLSRMTSEVEDLSPYQGHPPLRTPLNLTPRITWCIVGARVASRITVSSVERKCWLAILPILKNAQDLCNCFYPQFLKTSFFGSVPVLFSIRIRILEFHLILVPDPTESRARHCKLLRNPGIGSKESIPGFPKSLKNWAQALP